VALIRIYIDEDAAGKGLVTALRSHGVTVLTALEAGLTGKPDEEQLAYATERECVWTMTGKNHWLEDSRSRPSLPRPRPQHLHHHIISAHLRRRRT